MSSSSTSATDVTISQSDFWMLLLCTVRYAMGRRSYISAEMNFMLAQHKKLLDSDHLNQLAREIEIELNQAERMGHTLGDPADHDYWEKTLALIAPKRAWIRKARKAFLDAGFFGNFEFEEIPNEYCGPAGCSICAEHPWLLVKTHLGTFKVGWRKRVIELDWSQSYVKADAGVFAEMYKDPVTPTRYGQLIHCYGYGQLKDNLARLREVA